MRPRAGVAAPLFALVWLSCIWFGSWEWNVNQATRMYAALSIVEQHDATIDEYAPLTMDKARFGDHFYSDKAPGMTLMALPAVAFADAATGQAAHDLPIVLYDPAVERFLRWRLRLATASSVAVLTALAALAMFDLGRAIGGGTGAGVVTAIGFALGTPIWGWSTTLFGHAPVAALFVIATWATWRGTLEPAPEPRLAALAGLALGWALVIDHVAVLGGLAIGGWALWRLRAATPAGRRRAIVAAVIAGMVALVPLVAYNVAAFGTPFRIGYQGVVGFGGMREGVFGLTYPKPEVVAKLLAGDRRGLLWVAPVLAAGAIGLMRLAWTRTTRDLGLLAIGVAVLTLLCNASYVYWDGGASTGPRHLVPAIPFLALGLAPLWAMRSPAVRGALLSVLAGSMLINLIIAASEIVSGGTEPWPLWSDVIRNRFLFGQLRTLPSEWWGWSVWSGLALYLVLAALLTIAIARAARRDGLER